MSGAHAAPSRAPRITWWVFLSVQAFFLFWTVAAATIPVPPGEVGMDRAIMVWSTMFLWFAVDIVVGITYAIWRAIKK